MQVASGWWSATDRGAGSTSMLCRGVHTAQHVSCFHTFHRRCYACCFRCWPQRDMLGACLLAFTPGLARCCKPGRGGCRQARHPQGHFRIRVRIHCGWRLAGPVLGKSCAGGVQHTAGRTLFLRTGTGGRRAECEQSSLQVVHIRCIVVHCIRIRCTSIAIHLHSFSCPCFRARCRWWSATDRGAVASTRAWT